MAVSDTTIDLPEAMGTPDATAAQGSPLLICLASAYSGASQDQLAPVLDVLRRALQSTESPVGTVAIAYPSTQNDASPTEQDGFVLQPYHDIGSADSITVHTAGTWLSLYEAMRSHGSSAGLLLGAEAQTVAPGALRGMLDAVLGRGVDLALPCYALPQNQGLLNQAMFAPLTRALFAGRIGYPLALDAAFSPRMAERMAAAAQRFTAAGQNNATVWPVDEAAIAGFEMAEVGTTTRDLPSYGGDLSQVLRDVAGSLFADIEAKATFWQRTRPTKEMLRLDTAQVAHTPAAEPVDEAEIEDLLQSFRIGYSNLHDIWSLVLPPQTLVSLKRLSQAPRESFAVPHTLWVRIVYDFVLAHRLRTLSRGHLLGALAPLYLAWVASHLLALRAGTAGETDALARAFEADRPYLVSRWRWPDRFNP